MKPAIFHPAARQIIQDFPTEIRRELGKAIFDLQKGHKLTMPLSKPMSTVLKGAEEIRLKDRSGAFRVFYYARTQSAILIFHAFQKKSQVTLSREIEIGRKRLKELLDEKV